MSKALVSIIIPTYNRASLIGETLDSILEQTYPNWECIVVDDGSSDNTELVVDAFVKKDTRFQYYHRPSTRPKGANSCRNYGFEISKGEFVNWFDDDDIMMDNFIQTKMELFENNIDFVICSGTYADEKLNVLRDINLTVESFLFKDYVLWKLQVLTPSVLFRKFFLNGKELFNTKISRGQEAEFFSRLFYKLPEEKYLIVNVSLFFYRQHVDTKSYKSNGYVKSFKESQTFIALQNFDRSIELADSDLILYYYRHLVGSFFRSIENKHIENSKNILKKITLKLYKLNYILSVKFYCSGFFFIKINRGSYKIEKYFQNYNLLKK